MKMISFGKLRERLNKRKSKSIQNEDKKTNGLKESEDYEEECDPNRIDVNYDRLSSQNESNQRIDLSTTSSAANSHRYPIEFFRSFRNRFKKNKGKDKLHQISAPIHQNHELNTESNRSQTDLDLKDEELAQNNNEIDLNGGEVVEQNCQQLIDTKETQNDPQSYSDESMSSASKPIVSHNNKSFSEEELFNQSVDNLNEMDERKFSLFEEMDKLSKCGWYWGPITRCEAEAKLRDQMDGAFLVRDSSDDHYLFSLSFRSYGRTLHTRIEYTNGLFRFYSNTSSEGHHSIIELIEESISDSQKGVFCYSRGRSSVSPSFPVRLTKPVSRFTEVRSLQYLCKFVIRQTTNYSQIQSLPLPERIKGFIENGRY